MASTSQYKATGRTVRAGMLEVSPTAGMKFTNNPITEGYCKTMVNMDVDTTLGVLRPRPAYEDNRLANLLELAAVSNDYIGNDAKILFSGKLYVDIWDTTDAPTAIENAGAVRELDDATVQEAYGNTVITSELRDFIVVGCNTGSFAYPYTCYENVYVFEVYMDEESGEPHYLINYTDAFVGMMKPVYNWSALKEDASYVTATTYMKLKGLEYHYTKEVPMPKQSVFEQESFQKYAEAIREKTKYSSDKCMLIVQDTFRKMKDLLCKSPGISLLPAYDMTIHKGYSTRTPIMTVLQNTLYFMGHTRSDYKEYDLFIEEISNYIKSVSTYTDDKTINSLIYDFISISPELQNRKDVLISNNLKVLRPVERITKTKTEHFVCACNVTPQEPAASEVINYGYNMLLKNPYGLQSDHDFTANTILLDGILVKDPTTLDTRLHARVGENLRFELLYKTNKAYMDSVGGVRVRWELTDVTSSGNTTVLQDIWDSSVYNEDSDIYFEFQPSYKTFSILCKVYRENDVQEVMNDATLETLEDKYNSLSPVRSITLASYTLTDRVTNRQAELKEFDLTTAKGMVPWLERLVLWGIRGAETNIFVSEAGTTNYFPYPNGYDEFPAKVVKCLSYGQQLLVLTENELYLCTMNADGLTFTKQCIQTGLNISPWEKDNIIAIHNMVSFFSDDKIYLIVPKSGSLTGALQLAPISNQINYFLKDLSTNVLDILRRMYGLENHKVHAIVREQWKGDTPEDYLSNLGDVSLALKNKYTYVEGSKIVYTYAYALLCDAKAEGLPATSFRVPRSTPRAQDEHVLVSLIYDTNTRVWNLNIRQGGRAACVPFENGSSIDRQQLLTLKTFIDYDNNKTEDEHKECLHLLYITKNKESVQDRTISNNGVNSIDNPDSNLFLFKNYQFLDTGYRLTDVSRKKRFREVQFNLNNIDGYEIPMGCAIFVDDNERKMLYNYSVNIVRTTENSAEAVVTQSIDTRGLVHNTTLEARAEDIVHYNKEYATGKENMFLLDTTKFEQVSNYKVRIKTSGKGYSPRAQLLFKPKGYYELFYINWVYRSMSQR